MWEIDKLITMIFLVCCFRGHCIFLRGSISVRVESPNVGTKILDMLFAYLAGNKKCFCTKRDVLFIFIYFFEGCYARKCQSFVFDVRTFSVNHC